MLYKPCSWPDLSVRFTTWSGPVCSLFCLKTAYLNGRKNRSAFLHAVQGANLSDFHFLKKTPVPAGLQNNTHYKRIKISFRFYLCVN